MNRRKFLLGLASLPLFYWSKNLSFALGGEAFGDHLLILIEFKGGNDGLNTLVPFADPTYLRLRPHLGIPREQVLQLNQNLGFHPSLKKILPLWENKELALVQGVGYPQPNLSHFRSIEIWETASQSDEYLAQGWLSRTFEQNPTPGRLAADGIVIGQADMGPFLGRGAKAISFDNPRQFFNQAKRMKARSQATTNSSLRHILKTEKDIQMAAKALTQRHQFNYRFKTVFPKGKFGRNVQSAAQLVASQARISVIHLSLGGFDTHTHQRGTHERLLTQFAEGIFALRSALLELNHWQKTLIMTYSEFGRRAGENNNAGTDHGTANTHFFSGGQVQGGIYGPLPKLNSLEKGNLPFGIDFRSMYATVLRRWWGVNPNEVLGKRYPPLDILKA